MNLKLRLIDTPIPRNEWVWPAESQHPANRVVVQYVAKHFLFCRFIPAGRAWLTRCCAVDMGKIFPGWAKAFREDYVCEVEITVEKDSGQTQGAKNATN